MNINAIKGGFQWSGNLDEERKMKTLVKIIIMVKMNYINLLYHLITALSPSIHQKTFKKNKEV